MYFSSFHGETSPCLGTNYRNCESFFFLWEKVATNLNVRVKVNQRMGVWLVFQVEETATELEQWLRTIVQRLERQNTPRMRPRGLPYQRAWRLHGRMHCRIGPHVALVLAAQPSQSPASALPTQLRSVSQLLDQPCYAIVKFLCSRFGWRANRWQQLSRFSAANELPDRELVDF